MCRLAGWLDLDWLYQSYIVLEVAGDAAEELGGSKGLEWFLWPAELYQ